MIQCDDIKIEQFAFGPYSTNCYVVYLNAARVVIDAPPDSYSALKNRLAGTDVHLFLTHGHWDHMADASKFQKELNAKVYANDEDAFFFNDANKNLVFVPTGIDWHGVSIDHSIAGGEKIKIDGVDFEVLHTPGHSAGQIAVYLKCMNSVFVGDTIFSDGVGRTDLPGGDLEKLLHSIRKKIFELPAETVIYSGHGPKTTILKRKKI